MIGAITRDRIFVQGRALGESPGGVVHHAGLTLVALGARVRVLTRVHADDDEELLSPLREAGAEVRALPSRATTTYRNDYSKTPTRHELEAVSDPIEAGDVPEDWRRCELIQLGPLHRRDIQPEAAEAVQGLRGLDVQGFFREREPLEAVALTRFLACADVVQASSEDLPRLTHGEAPGPFAYRHAIQELLITQGARGAELWTSSGVARVPVRRIDLEGTTSGEALIGAGDGFLASYLYARACGCTPEPAAHRAAELAVSRIEQKLPRDEAHP